MAQLLKVNLAVGTRLTVQLARFTVLLVALCGVCWCCRAAGDPSSGVGAEAASAPVSELRVGVILPLTGPAGDYGVAMKNSIALAMRERPELFTHIRFFFEDAAYDPKTAVVAFRKLTAGDDVHLTITWGVPFCKALAPIAEARKTPLIGICLDPTVSTGRRFVLQFFNTTDELMQLQASYLNARGVKRIGVLLADNPYLEEVSQALARNLQPQQSLHVIDRLPATEMDLRTHIIKLLKHRDQFDAVGVFLYVGQIASFYRQARSLKFDMLTFGHPTFESLSEVRASNGAMNGSIFTSIRVNDAFLTRYKEIFRNESQVGFGAPTYELALTLGQLFNNTTEPLSGEAIVEKIAKIPPQKGVASGPYAYTNDRTAGQHFKFPLAVKQIVNGSINQVEW
jgi:ABC-type branched-subunit amino acid transport system substrate-binding protein